MPASLPSPPPVRTRRSSSTPRRRLSWPRRPARPLLAAGSPRPQRRQRPRSAAALRGAMRLVGGLVQPQLPFADIPNGSAAAAEKEAAKEQDAASTEAPAAPEAAPAPAPEAAQNDQLAALMARAARHEEALREHLAAAPLHPARLRPHHAPRHGLSVRPGARPRACRRGARTHLHRSGRGLRQGHERGHHHPARDRQDGVAWLSAHVRRVAQALRGRRFRCDRGGRPRCRHVRRVPGRYPEWCQRRARARRGSVSRSS